MQSTLHYLLTSAGDLSADFNSNPAQIAHFSRFSLQAVWTGTPTGDFTLQTSNDEGVRLPDGTFSGISNWNTVAATTVAAGGADGSYTWDLPTSCRYVRVHYARTGGTGSVAIRISAKEF